MVGSNEKVVRHDMSRRRTLMKRSELLKRYGFRVFIFFYVGILGTFINQRYFNPPEYATKEEEELANNRFTLNDLWKRGVGVIEAMVSLSFSLKKIGCFILTRDMGSGNIEITRTRLGI